ncbi:unnamed protein product [Caenorhabditis nigoni]
MNAAQYLDSVYPDWRTADLKQVNDHLAGLGSVLFVFKYQDRMLPSIIQVHAENSRTSFVRGFSIEEYHDIHHTLELEHPEERLIYAMREKYLYPAETVNIVKLN